MSPRPAHPPPAGPSERARAARLWFVLTPEERRAAAAVLLIFLVGLLARYLYLRRERAEFYSGPEPIEAAAEATGTPP